MEKLSSLESFLVPVKRDASRAKLPVTRFQKMVKVSNEPKNPARRNWITKLAVPISIYAYAGRWLRVKINRANKKVASRVEPKLCLILFRG